MGMLVESNNLQTTQEMKRTKVVDALKCTDFGKDINVKGWVRSHRSSKAVDFIALNDGSTINNIQVVVDPATVDAETLKSITTGACLSVVGTLVESQGKGQTSEIQCKEIEVYGLCPADYPMQKKGQSFEYMRKYAHLRLRTNTFGAVFRIRHNMAIAIHKYFHDHGFYYFHTPIVTASDCEGAGEMFKVTTLDIANSPKNEDGTVDFKQDFFEKPAYLTVSGQLEGEAMALAFGKIYTFGPTFRAEKSYTQRHAAEFWMIEPEIAFADLNDDMELAEAMIKYVISYVMENCKSELEFLNKFVDKGLLERLNSVVSSDFARVTYTDAVKELEKYNDEFDYKVYWGCDLQTEHERCLTERIFKRPVFVTDYPKEIKAFYMRLNDDGKTVAAVDLLVMGIGEIIGGSQREERLDVLTERIEELGLDPKDYWWYLDLRRYGGVKHSGFGLGFERLVMYLTGISNIRDVLPFPRTTGSADF